MSGAFSDAENGTEGVTHGDGTYRVVYLPRAGYFSLCVESDFGPLDIGVHGPAPGCFASV